MKARKDPMGLLARAFGVFLRIFAVDKRSLALYRVGMGLVTLYDLNLRFPDIHNHYSDRGIISRSFALDKFQNNYWISIHMLAGTDFYMQVLFLLHMLISLCMAVGYHTRLFTFLNWLMVCSVQNRNYVVCHSGDTLHRVILFWSIFLPLGEVFSLDSLRKKHASKKEHSKEHTNYEVIGTPAMAITIQIYIMYATAHFHKSSPEWRTMGVATWMALQLDFFRTSIGDLFNMSPWLCKQLTFFVLYWQVSGCIIYFVPLGRVSKYLRAFSVFGYMCMHLGFGLCLDLETFTWVTEAALLALIPAWVWDESIKLMTKGHRKGLHVYYLKRCRFCSNLAEILGLFMLPNAKVIPTDSLPVSHAYDFFGISVVDTTNRVQLTGPAALEAIFKASPILYLFHYLFKTRTVKSVLYSLSQQFHCHQLNSVDRLEQPVVESGMMDEHPNFVNIHVPDPESKDSMGSSESMEHVDTYSDTYSDSPQKKKKTFKTESVNMYALRKTIPLVGKLVVQLWVGFCLFLILTWNAGNIHYYALATPPSLKPIMWVTQLDQYWGMFAPRPPDVMWWYNIEAELDDGTKAELFNDGALFTFIPHIPHTFDKPKYMHKSMGNHRWFKLFENGLNSHDSRDELRLNFGRWLCREYNSKHFDTKRLYKFSIHWMNERVDIQKQDGTRYPGTKQTIWNHICYDK